jgi:hypothetical protein
LAAFTDQGNKILVPFFQGLLAEIEAQVDAEGALTRIEEEALVLAGKTGEHWSDAFLHRCRGEILLKRGPGEYGASRGCIRRCNRHRTTTKGTEFRASRGALAGEALSLNGPTRRRPCRARVCAQGFFADPGISRDRTSASAACRPRRNRRSEERRRVTPT